MNIKLKIIKRNYQCPNETQINNTHSTKINSTANASANAIKKAPEVTKHSNKELYK